MFDETTRNAIALKKFSIISPVINGQVNNNKAYYIKTAEQPIDMPYYGTRRYAPKTLESWYCEYMHGGIDVLKPGLRGDRGNCRKISSDLGVKILEKKKSFPKVPDTLLYEMLIQDGILEYDKISLSTLYRFLNSAYFKGVDVPGEEKKDFKRFSHEYINELWQADLMYGPCVRDGRQKKQTYLFSYIDDASRLITYAEFFFSQNFEMLRYSFREAVLKRGIPRLIYTDNGKIYRSQQFEFMCASIGSTLIHSKPFEPNGRGKIERFFRTVRKRFLSSLAPEELKDINDLNIKFRRWLEEDYQRKPHTSLEGKSPIDFFMGQVDRVKIYSDPSGLEDKFLLRIKRKVNHDGTFSIKKVLFETERKFAGLSVEIRYDPQWLMIPFMPVFIYIDDKKAGEAMQINFHDNAHMKRRGRPVHSSGQPVDAPDMDTLAEDAMFMPKQTISFAAIMERGV
jgi:putative transposase